MAPNRKLFAAIIVMILASMAPSAYAKRSASISMIKTGYNELEEETGRHTPTRPLECVIDESLGILFSCQPAPEIASYGIYDVTGNCVAIFGDEESFIDFLFTLSGEYQLVFTTASYDLVGYIYL